MPRNRGTETTFELTTIERPNLVVIADEAHRPQYGFPSLHVLKATAA